MESFPHAEGISPEYPWSSPSFSAKALEIFNYAVPRIRSQSSDLWNPTTPSHVQVLKACATGKFDRLGIQLFLTPVQSVADFKEVFATLERERADGFPGALITINQTTARSPR